MLDLDQGPCAIKRLRGCGCGNEYVAITPDGDIYPCHQFVGLEEYKMGNLDEGTFNLDMKAEFAASHVYTKPECKKCWAKFYCAAAVMRIIIFMQEIYIMRINFRVSLRKSVLNAPIMMKAARTGTERCSNI